MLYILTISSTSEPSTAILHDLKNAVYNAYWTALFIYSASGLPLLPFLPLSSKKASGKTRSTVARLEAGSVDATQLEALRAYELHAHAQ